MSKVDYPPEIQKKLKRILKPILSVLHRQYKPCYLCGTETSWTVNNNPVCPKCQVEYNFTKADRIPDACEVCECQGEWVCGKNDQHSLCCRHRDAWFTWTREPFLPRGYAKLPEEERNIAWEKAFTTFIQEMKEVLYTQ